MPSLCCLLHAGSVANSGCVVIELIKQVFVQESRKSKSALIKSLAGCHSQDSVDSGCPSRAATRRRDNQRTSRDWSKFVACRKQPNCISSDSVAYPGSVAPTNQLAWVRRRSSWSQGHAKRRNGKEGGSQRLVSSFLLRTNEGSRTGVGRIYT